jgi:hypothetical protein
MNTVITNADYTHPKDLYNRIKAVFPFWDILSLWEQERIQKACDKQDSFTRLELAKAVREMMIPVNDSRMEKGFNIGFNVGYSKALQAVLKVMEGE